jgi:hypothetical protein
MRFSILFFVSIAWTVTSGRGGGPGPCAVDAVESHESSGSNSLWPGQRRSHRSMSAARMLIDDNSTTSPSPSNKVCTANGTLAPDQNFYHDDEFNTKCDYCQNYNGWDIIPVPSNITDPNEAEAFQKDVWSDTVGLEFPWLSYNTSCYNECVTCYQPYTVADHSPEITAFCGIVETKTYYVVQPLNDSWLDDAVNRTPEFAQQLSMQFTDLATSMEQVCITYKNGRSGTGQALLYWYFQLGGWQ